MTFIAPNLSVPLRQDEDGTLWIANTQVRLEEVITKFQLAYTPERINHDLPTLEPADIYAVIAYYLTDKAETDTYGLQQEEKADRLWDAKQELFESFGKHLIERVRDKEISYADGFLDQKAPFAHQYKDELDSLTPEQMAMLKRMVVHWIDGTIHDFLFLLEDGTLEGDERVKLQIESKSVTLEDIRGAESGDLQGYIFIWAEKYSTKRQFEL
jgi:uncharacterized protein (DUF433 family)